MSSIEGKIRLAFALGGHNNNNNNNNGPAEIFGDAINVVGFGSAIIAVVGGGVVDDGDETYLLAVQHSDNGVAWEDVPGKSIMLDPAMSFCFCQSIVLNGLGTNTKRFIRLRLLMNGTTPRFEGGIVAILGDPAFEPVTLDADM